VFGAPEGRLTTLTRQRYQLHHPDATKRMKERGDFMTPGSVSLRLRLAGTRRAALDCTSQSLRMMRLA
jgi:hypothetical protein